MNNGQIFGLTGNFFGQSLTNNSLENSNFFIGQQYISIHFFSIPIKKTTTTTMNQYTRESMGCQEGLSAIS